MPDKNSTARIHVSGNTGNIMSGSMPHTTHTLTVVIFIDTSLCGKVCRFRTPLSGGDFVLYGADSRFFT
ncbi:Uncharacterised protein [Salmonella enterica subsp. enterica]|uniref:Uncharacterized protein n=2 Tax=Salmonella enterica I TaxID=59201 RepID=A0A3S4KCS6_SALET|nr:Uncharacterised protein [Salmonella enterica subsp. enterica]